LVAGVEAHDPGSTRSRIRSSRRRLRNGRAITTVLIASVTLLHPHSGLKSTPPGGAPARDRTLSTASLRPSEATVAVEAAVRLLRLLAQAPSKRRTRDAPHEATVIDLAAPD
jgi:hypothetical protein